MCMRACVGSASTRIKRSRRAVSAFTPLPSSLAAKAFNHRRVVISSSAAVPAWPLAAARRTSVPGTSALATIWPSSVSQL